MDLLNEILDKDEEDNDNSDEGDRENEPLMVTKVAGGTFTTASKVT